MRATDLGAESDGCGWAALLWGEFVLPTPTHDHNNHPLCPSLFGNRQHFSTFWCTLPLDEGDVGSQPMIIIIKMILIMTIKLIKAMSMMWMEGWMGELYSRNVIMRSGWRTPNFVDFKLPLGNQYFQCIRERFWKGSELL